MLRCMLDHRSPPEVLVLEPVGPERHRGLPALDVERRVFALAMNMSPGSEWTLRTALDHLADLDSDESKGSPAGTRSR